MLNSSRTAEICLSGGVASDEGDMKQQYNDNSALCTSHRCEGLCRPKRCKDFLQQTPNAKLEQQQEVDKPVTIHGAVNDECLVNCNNHVTFFADTERNNSIVST